VVATPAEAPRQQQSTRVASAAQPAASPSSQASSSSGLFGNLFSSSGSKDQPSSGKESGGMLDRMSRLVGLSSSEPAAESAPAPKAKPAPKPAQTAAKPKSDDSKPGAIRQPPKPPSQEANAEPQDKPSSNASLLNGSQPTVPAGSFDTRWGQFR
jgi:hypothetical protein